MISAACAKKFSLASESLRRGFSLARIEDEIQEPLISTATNHVPGQYIAEHGVL